MVKAWQPRWGWPEADNFGCPVAIQTRDARMQVVLTSDERTVVSRAILAESWIRQEVPPWLP